MGTKQSRGRGGYVLIAILIILVVLTLLAYRFTDAMTAEYRGAARTADMAKLRAAAVSGIYYTAASLADPNTVAQMGGISPLASPSIFNNQSYFGDQIVYTDPNNPNRSTMFSIVSVVPAPGTSASTTSQGITYQQQYGVTDEGAKLNINAWAAIDPTGNALYSALLELPNMAANPQIAANIVAYVLPSTAAPLSNNAPVGAQSNYYEGLQNPYEAKNGPLNSLDELLLVEGVTPQLLYGNDQNLNGLPDDAQGQAIDRGWQDYLTVNGRELNVNSSGTLRIYLNGSNLNGIYTALQSSTVNSDLVTYIMGAKLYGTTPVTSTSSTSNTSGGGKGGGKGGGPSITQGSISDLNTQITTALQNNSGGGKPITSLAMLLNTQVQFTVGTGKDAKITVVPSPLTTSTLSQYLPTLMDQTTTLGKGGSVQVELTPRINVTTASAQVLTMLPVLTASDVANLTSAQANLTAGDPATTSGAWLVTSGGLSLSKYSAISQYVTGTSMLYRVQAIGYYSGTEQNGSNGSNATNWPMARVEALIDTNLGLPRIVYIRDLTSVDNPRGFTLPLVAQQ
jgi:Tfp pilus assembly protein PilX